MVLTPPSVVAMAVLCRDAGRGEKAVQEIRESTGNQNVHLHVCDVSSFQQIR